jgi:hypothetical protein
VAADVAAVAAAAVVVVAVRARPLNNLPKKILPLLKRTHRLMKPQLRQPMPVTITSRKRTPAVVFANRTPRCPKNLPLTRPHRKMLRYQSQPPR